MRALLGLTSLRALAVALPTALAFAPATLAQGEGLDLPLSGASPLLLDPACAPETEACQTVINGRLTAVLLYLAETKSPATRAVAAIAADADSVRVRAEAARALGALLPDAGDTPVLAELLDDPVPSVRLAALEALRSSSDERGRLLAARADRFGLAKSSEETEDVPQEWPATAAMGVPMPKGALFLHFGSDPAQGRYSWVTTEPAARVRALYGGKGNRSFTIQEYESFLEQEDAEASERQNELEEEMQVDEGEMPSAEQMAKAMEMAQKAMQAMNEASDESAEAQARAMGEALGGARLRDSSLTNLYRQEELFGDVRITLVPVDKTSEIVVVVYDDLALKMTGVGVHRPEP